MASSDNTDGAGTADQGAAFAATEQSPSRVRHGSVLARGTSVGRYTLVERIGSGGMGTVYSARDSELDRRVAIKLIDRSGGTDERLLEEARAMARLAHPSIVPVFDVGTVEDYLYIVMPLLEGGTLGSWMQSQERSWKEVTERFVRAGRGLAAAHKAGIVHRDFKPANVVLDGNDVVIIDFGIAHGDRAGSSNNAGTRAYMAPELVDGRNADERSDQYSYCVSFWEGLHGERPRSAETISSPRPHRTIPRWLRLAIARGFASAPDDRWPSLDVLLDHIAARRRRPRTVALVSAAALVLVSSAGAVALSRDADGDRCRHAPARLATVWGPQRGASIASALAATQLPYAKGLGERILRELDTRASAWRETRLETCRAPRSKVPDTTKDLRNGCLDRWLLDLDAAAQILASATDAKSVDEASNTARALTSPSECADDARLRALVPPNEKRAAADAIDAAVRELDVKRRGAPAATALAEVDALISRARELAHAPTLARALRLKAIIQREANDAAGRKGTLEELAQASAAAGDDSKAAEAWLELVMVLKQQKHYDAAQRILPAGSAAVIRAGSPTNLRAMQMEAEAVVLDGLGEGKRALELLAQARTMLLEAGAGTEGSDLAWRLQGITVAFGGAQGNAGDYAGSIETFKAAIANAETLVGPEHPNVARLYENLGESLRRAERNEEALAAFQKTEEIVRASLGESVGLVRARSKTAAQLYLLGQTDESVAQYEALLPLARRQLKPDDPFFIGIKNDLSVALREVNRHGEALTMIDEVIAHYEQLGETSTSYVLARNNRGGTLRELKRYDESVTEYQRTLELLATTKNAARHIVRVNVGLGQTLLAAGRPAYAISPLQVASDDASAGRSESLQRKARWLLGRARIEAGRDPGRGRNEIDAARAELAAAGESEEVAEIDKWLSSH